jgi:hypothetical protein
MGTSAALEAIHSIRVGGHCSGGLRGHGLGEQCLEPRYAQRLLADQPGHIGYLLKRRVSDIAVLIDAMQRVAVGECVLDNGA